jgi:hypothetical protein
LFIAFSWHSVAKWGQQVFHSATPLARAAIENELKWHCQARAERLHSPDREIA